jgi:hypothetical protein
MSGNKEQKDPLSAKRRMQVSEALRGLGVMLNTAAIYHPDHPVFQRAVEDRFPAFQEALADKNPLTVHFDKDNLIVSGSVIEHGNQVFTKVARVFSQKGIGGLTFQPGLKADELVDLVMVVREELGRSSDSLGKLLRVKGVKNIQEEKLLKGTGDGSGTGGPGGGGPSGISASSAAKRTGGVFELDLEDLSDEKLAEIMPPQDHIETGIDVSTAQVKTFVLNEIQDLQSGRKSPQAVADRIAADFEQRLNERVEEVRRETEVRIQRLESIKELVLEELESRNLAAVIVNAQLQVLAQNNSARTLLGDLDRLESDSELADFAGSNDEKRALSVRGKECEASMIISDHPDAEGGAVLICLEPEK